MIEEHVVETYEEEREKKGYFGTIFSWLGKNFKFLFVPGYIPEDLIKRRQDYEMLRSKRKFIRRLRSALTMFGIGLIFTIVTFAVFAPWIAQYSFYDLTSFFWNAWQAPSSTHLAGTTDYGRDVLGRLIWGARSSLTIALPALLFAVFFGVIIGIVSGYFGGWVDGILMRIMDIFLAFPGIILILVMISIFGPRMEFFMLAYGILGVAGYSRLIRGSVLQAKELPYVEAARVSGAGHWRLIFRHILPNTFQPVLISFTFDIGGIILSLAGLSFLGYGDAHLIEWGNDIAIGRYHLYDAPWAALWPGFMIVLTVLGFMLLGDGLRDALDPRLKNL
ncbi:MAG: ABC transporter permease [Candidatus Lokiarchaeota archaeon]|nr:ABC transporter permease [Candidatus Lokiarchaeota archaeon]